MTLEAKTLGIAIRRNWREVYDAIWQPEVFPRWASGLAGSLARDGETWVAQSPGGPVTIRFSPHNAFGVMDHWVTLADGRAIYVPLRIVANDDGAEEC